MPGGGTNDVFEMNVFVENDGETPVKEFLLVLEMPSNFPDGSIPYGMKIESAPPGFVRWSRTNTSSGVRVEILYPDRKTESLIRFNGAVRAQTKQHPEELEENYRDRLCWKCAQGVQPGNQGSVFRTVTKSAVVTEAASR